MFTKAKKGILGRLWTCVFYDMRIGKMWLRVGPLTVEGPVFTHPSTSSGSESVNNGVTWSGRDSYTVVGLRRGQCASMWSTTMAKIPTDASVVPATKSVAKGAGIMASDCRAARGGSRSWFQLCSKVEHPVTSTANGRASSSNHSVHVRAEYHMTIR